MKCPVCGYENDSEDVECIACGSDMALAEESIAIEKRRSEEAMERYHEQQRELRRELGIERPEDERPAETVPDDDVPAEAQAGPWEASLELEEIPSDFHSNDVLCPQCGFRNGQGAIECARCGVIFRKLKNPLGNGNGNGLTVGSPSGGIAIDPSKYGLEAMPPDAAVPPVQNGRDAHRDDLGECFVETEPGYSPYVHEVKSESWSGAKATVRWVKDVWAGADFEGKGQGALKGLQRLGHWLKGVSPKWYGVTLGVLLVLVSLPFVWKGGGLLMSGWEQRSQVKREAMLVEAFTQNNSAIRREIRALANNQNFEEARAALARFDIGPLKTKLEPLERYLDEKETYARVLTVPSWKFETNYTLFTRLVALNPSSELYRSKQAFYKQRLADQCYDKALRHYQSQKSDAAESAQAVALIEKSVAFYPKNRNYKELRRKLISANLLFYKGNSKLQMALRDEGRGAASYEKQRKITVWLRNTGEEAIYINPDFFTLATSNGKTIKYNNMMETGFDGKLAPGEKTAGVLYFRTLAMPRQLTFEHLVAGAVQREFP
ncbi:hypothetical protein DSLASN_17990 [Desulfoluna limicola]|uniref:RanBP2-type domain-containing protein n=1 Tax=Desulfoluna limicola TaxID=2810562 RepID=A0ABN6F3U7_9BACT|nr:zinc finger protein [Desulfoluna limicola]BCS96167.1 hypothetical protein DSLASN_17990 [Desulfoluna limicola]